MIISSRPIMESDQLVMVNNNDEEYLVELQLAGPTKLAVTTSNIC